MLDTHNHPLFLIFYTHVPCQLIYMNCAYIFSNEYINILIQCKKPKKNYTGQGEGGEWQQTSYPPQTWCRCMPTNLNSPRTGDRLSNSPLIWGAWMKTGFHLNLAHCHPCRDVLLWEYNMVASISMIKRRSTIFKTKISIDVKDPKGANLTRFLIIHGTNASQKDGSQLLSIPCH